MLTEQQIRLSGDRQVTVYQSGTGPAVLYLHGLYGVTLDVPLIEALAHQYTVFAPLAPGFADLAELDHLHDIHDLALQYDDVLDALELDRAQVVGHSFGAMIAAELAAHVPARVSRLVLLSPLGLWNDAYPVADLWGVPPSELPGLLYADPSRAPAGSPGQTLDVEAAVAAVRGMTAVARFLWPLPDRGLSRRIGRARMPTLVIHGEHDRFVPVQYAHDLVGLLPNASVEVIPSAGHMLTVEALDAVVQMIGTRMEVHA